MIIVKIRVIIFKVIIVAIDDTSKTYIIINYVIYR
jgi:hypothetical protein